MTTLFDVLVDLALDSHAWMRHVSLRHRRMPYVPFTRVRARTLKSVFVCVLFVCLLFGRNSGEGGG